mgnify:CR=1 FL=1
MNKTQLLVMWVGIAIVVLMGIFPPWAEQVTYIDDGVRRCIAGGYHWLWFRHFPSNSELTIYTTRLAIQCLIVALLTAGFVFTFKEKDQKLKDEQNHK